MNGIKKFVFLAGKESFGTIVFLLCLASIAGVVSSLFSSSLALFSTSFAVFLVTGYAHSALHKVSIKPLSEIFPET